MSRIINSTIQMYEKRTARIEENDIEEDVVSIDVADIVGRE